MQSKDRSSKGSCYFGNYPFPPFCILGFGAIIVFIMMDFYLTALNKRE